MTDDNNRFEDEQDDAPDERTSLDEERLRDLDTVFADDWPEDHRSGVIAVVGRPNVGKSTLINRIVGQKIAAVSPKPQTTRRRQLGIYTEEKGQLLFIDTPGLHAPRHKLGEFMVGAAEAAFNGADRILVVLNVSEAPEAGDRHLAETVARLRGETPVVLALNKTDLLPSDATRLPLISQHGNLIEHEQLFLVSALTGGNVPELTNFLMAQMPLGPRYYPADQVSEVNMRFIAGEIIREKAMLRTEKEVPHAIAVEVESFQETPELTRISGIIYVERDNQKAIVIGRGGDMIKQIGTEARLELESMLDRRVRLDLRVKVLKNWRSDDRLMRRMGYKVERDEK
ncbi:MAG: GTPase Era [Blastochloris sp.]|nr:GTPase Era [Blastochloris sp.]